MSLPPANIASVLEPYRRGDLARARAIAEAQLDETPDSLPLRSLAGLIACQSGDPAGGATHLRLALAAAPGDIATRINLATALVATRALEEAAAVCAAGGADPRLLRIAGYVHQESGRPSEAASAYEAVVAAMPDDFQSWNNLGNARAAAGDLDGAVLALQRAIQLRPDIAPIQVNLSKILGDLDRPEPRRRIMREAARLAPADADVQAELGLAEAAMQDFEAAERAYREAIRLRPGSIGAWLDLAVLLESTNEVDALETLAEEAERAGLPPGEAGFIRAWALRRQNRFAEALPLATAVPETVNPVRRFQLIGEIADRLGDTGRATSAFVEMNRAALASVKPVHLEGPGYIAHVAAAAARLSPAWIAQWTRVEIEPASPAPIFIIGFPRSGTTLLDTLLMNIPLFHVLEELPVMRHVEDALGDPERLAHLSSAEANALRARYFEALNDIALPAPGQRIVDKFPLHMARIPLIHRIFPDAKIIFVERHPCDAVLSCFMSSFELNHAMLSFVTLEGAARLYDAAFDAWTRARDLLPLDVHVVRYERMIEDLEAEMRPLLTFIDVPWDAAVLDNQASAHKRARISTASYSQVTEPIYNRSVGRWQRYSGFMKDVVPLLRPWAERMDYVIPAEPV